MSVYLNPLYKPHRELGHANGDWDALKNKLTAFFEANAEKARLTRSEIRNVDPMLNDDKTFRQVLSDLGVVVIP